MKIKVDYHTIENELKQLVHNWIRAYQTKDIKLMKQILSDNKKSFSFGTGADEKIEGLDGMLLQLKRDWSQCEDSTLELLSFRCDNFGESCAWIACEILPSIKICGQYQSFPPLRATMVTAKENGSYKIVHSHASWPHQNQKPDQSFPRLK